MKESGARDGVWVYLLCVAVLLLGAVAGSLMERERCAERQPMPGVLVAK